MMLSLSPTGGKLILRDRTIRKHRLAKEVVKDFLKRRGAISQKEQKELILGGDAGRLLKLYLFVPADGGKEGIDSSLGDVPVDETLRVPLDPKHEGVITSLNALNEPICRSSIGDQPPAQFLHCLVMGSVHLQGVTTHDLPQLRPWLDFNLMAGIFFQSTLLVLYGAGDLRGNVLVEGASEGHVDGLLAPAHPEQGEVSLEGLRD